MSRLEMVAWAVAGLVAWLALLAAIKALQRLALRWLARRYDIRHRHVAAALLGQDDELPDDTVFDPESCDCEDCAAEVKAAERAARRAAKRLASDVEMWVRTATSNGGEGR